MPKKRQLSIRTLFPMSSQRGQVLLIVVLVMVVALTVGLSVATRSITNVRTTTEEDNSQRAFSAAEAGIERALKEPGFTGGNLNQGLGNNATIKSVVVTDIGPQSNTYVLGSTTQGFTTIEKNIGWDVWFAAHDGPGGSIGTLWSSTANPSITFIWGANQPANPCSGGVPALEVIFLAKTGVNYVTTHRVFDPCTSHGNSFDPPSATFTSGSYPVTEGSTTIFLKYRAKISGGSNIVLAKVIPLYADSIVAVTTNPVLPKQGEQIDATGESGETFRKITVNHPYPQIPTELFNVLFSP